MGGRSGIIRCVGRSPWNGQCISAPAAVAIGLQDFPIRWSRPPHSPLSATQQHEATVDFDPAGCVEAVPKGTIGSEITIMKTREPQRWKGKNTWHCAAGAYSFLSGLYAVCHKSSHLGSPGQIVPHGPGPRPSPSKVGMPAGTACAAPDWSPKPSGAPPHPFRTAARRCHPRSAGGPDTPLNLGRNPSPSRG
ncbi:MAG: hypothetical protein JWM59_3324 [Verrucomicrobiales bacterium]|nr:hypothetical protein [Verrucomicrobiales bacterium]